LDADRACGAVQCAGGVLSVSINNNVWEKTMGGEKQGGKRMTVLIVGGGIGGMSAALALDKIGAQVHLIDIDPQWRVYGAGITITGPTLRAFEAIGIYDEIAGQGYVGQDIQVCS